MTGGSDIFGLESGAGVPGFPMLASRCTGGRFAGRGSPVRGFGVVEGLGLPIRVAMMRDDSSPNFSSTEKE